jgi:hypothetical protein
MMVMLFPLAARMDEPVAARRIERWGLRSAQDCYCGHDNTLFWFTGDEARSQ